MTAFFNPLVLLVLIVSMGLSAGAGYYTGNKSGKAAVMQEWDKEKALVAQAVADELSRVRVKEGRMQSSADKLRKEKESAQRDNSARADAIAVSLRERPRSTDSAGGMSSNAGDRSTSEWCTGERLYQDHAELLAREAARANDLRDYASYCYSQYNEVRAKLQTPP